MTWQTVGYLGWKGVKNGQLLRLAQEHGFDVLLTRDQALPYENSIPDTVLRVVVLACSPHLAVLRGLVPAIERTLPLLQPGEVRRLR